MGLAVLFYLQFGIQALSMSSTQATLVFLGVAALAVGVYRAARALSSSLIVCIGTLPILIFHVVTTLMFDDESPIFILMFAVAPICAGAAWLVTRVRADAQGWQP